MRRILVQLVVLLSAYGGLVYWLPEATVSPGDLIAGHGQIAGNCFRCHTPLRGTPSAKCIGCHAIATIGLRLTTGAPIARANRTPPFHQALRDPACVSCHSDHLGAGRPGATAVFTHELLRKDVLATCTDCHGDTAPNDNLHRAAPRTCGSCHGFGAWKPATFAHEKYFRFDRHHPAKQCQACHPDSLDRYTCYGCHAHTPQGLAREHREERITDFDNCVKCHRSGDEHETEGRSRASHRSRGSRSSHDD